MSAATSPNPNNLILLAVIGIGAYWLFSRRALAAQPVVYANGNQSRNTSTDLAKLGLVVQGTNLIGRLLTNINKPYGSQLMTQQGQENVAYINQQDSDPDLNGSVYDLLSGSTDGLAVNPPGNVAPYDWF